MLRRVLSLPLVRVPHARRLHAALTPSVQPGMLPLVTGIEGLRYGIADTAALDCVLDNVLSERSFKDEADAVAARLAEVQRALGPLRAADDAIAKRCVSHASLTLSAIGGALAIQFGVLFNWVFFVFDWNLVEPVTYFLGYTIIWGSLMFYRRTGKEFTYESIVDCLKDRKRKKLEKKLNFDAAAFGKLEAEEAMLMERIRKL